MGDIDALHDPHQDLRPLFMVGIKGLYRALDATMTRPGRDQDATMTSSRPNLTTIFDRL